MSQETPVVPFTTETEGKPEKSLVLELTPYQVDKAIVHWLTSQKHVTLEDANTTGTLRTMVSVGIAPKNNGCFALDAYRVELWFVPEDGNGGEV